jgi:FAD/FMN-containing dehydrogenase
MDASREATGTSRILIQRLRDIVGAEGIATDAASREDAARDALGAQRGFVGDVPPLPLVVALPRTADEVASIARLAAELRVPIVPYGGGTGLMGGARTRQAGIVVETTRMSSVREIDAVARTAWVEAGAVLKDVDDALRPHGLMIGHDPWTYGIATIGGAISTNGLGFLAGKYGSMGDQVLGVEAVLADGSIVRTRPVRPKSTGVDLSRLFIAGEGQFGIITAAALRVFPMPESRVHAGFTFETFEHGFDAILAMDALGMAPALLDYGERPAMVEGAATGHPRVGEPPTLYVGFDGLREEVSALMARAVHIFERHGGKGVEPTNVDEFWSNRHVIAENFARHRRTRRAENLPAGEGRCFDYIHVSLPASRVLEYRRRALAIAAQHDVHVLEAGLWVLPGLFSLAMANAAKSQAEAAAGMSATVDACLREALALGGSMEYCHGVGVRLAHLMRDEHGTGLDAMRAIKRALDPQDTLNPGKIFVEPDD